jgi:putative peptidoglycan lipid II flippase
MFLKAGALSLALLLASRLLGLLRESMQAAAFGASGLADVAVLMLTLPDWIAGLLASGALAYVLVPAWAGRPTAQVAAAQRKVARNLVLAGVFLAVLLVAFRGPAAQWLAGGLPAPLLPVAQDALVWSAVALPAALLAALWTTRLQHESDFTGMYSANLVVNAVLIASIAAAARLLPDIAMLCLGAGLLVAMLARLGWLHWRAPRPAAAAARPESAGDLVLPAVPVWLWAALSAGLPLALPFAARSIASHAGEGALATFNYAWKLVELPLVLAIQLVAALAFPAVARATAACDASATRTALRAAFALAWALACAAAAGLLVGAPAVAQLLFGWGRMQPQALARVSQWGATGAWGLLPQALIAVALTVLAARGRMKIAVIAYGAAVALLLAYALRGAADGAALMVLLNVLLCGVAVAVVTALGAEARGWLPWRSMTVSLACLVVLAAAAGNWFSAAGLAVATGLAAAIGAAALVMAATWWGSPDLRRALAR